MSESLNAPFARSERPRLSCNSTVTNSQQSDSPVSPSATGPKPLCDRPPIRNYPQPICNRFVTVPQPSLTAKDLPISAGLCYPEIFTRQRPSVRQNYPLHRFALHEAAFEPPAHRFVVQTQAQPRQQDAASVNQRAAPQRFRAMRDGYRPPTQCKYRRTDSA